MLARLGVEKVIYLIKCYEKLKSLLLSFWQVPDPFKYVIDIYIIFCRDAVAGDLSVLDAFQVDGLDEVLLAERALDVVLVAEEDEGDALERGPGKQLVELGFGDVYIALVGGVHHEDDYVRAPAVLQS